MYVALNFATSIVRDDRSLNSVRTRRSKCFVKDRSRLLLQRPIHKENRDDDQHLHPYESVQQGAASHDSGDQSRGDRSDRVCLPERTDRYGGCAQECEFPCRRC